MKKIKIFGLLVAAITAINSAAYAQKGLELTLKYNSGADKYEVYAKPNFSNKVFLLGSSQISVLVPANAPNEKLNISNADGGEWGDNSIVYAPAAKAAFDFHGINTMGDKMTLVAGQETLLFTFSLPKSVNPLQVQLFENGKDPNSSASGMRGGDFANAIYDAYDNEVYLRNYKEGSKRTIDNLGNLEKLFNPNSALSIYPNITKDHFNITLNGVDDAEDLTVTVSTEMGREVMKTTGTKKAIQEKTFNLPADIQTQSLIVRVKTNSTMYGKRLIVEKE